MLAYSKLSLMLVEPHEGASNTVPDDVGQACELRRVMEKVASYQVVAEMLCPVQAQLFNGIEQIRKAHQAGAIPAHLG